MTLLKRKRVLAAKIESTPGTAESLSASDGAFNAYDVIAQAEIAVESRQSQGSFGRLPGVPGARAGTLSFKVDLGWDGTATLPTWATTLLPMCGWVNSSGTLTPRTEAPGTNVKTGTLATYIDGVKKTIAGACGNVRFVFPSGRMAFAEFSFRGVWQAVADVSLISPTYPTALPIRYASAITTYDSVAMCVEQLTIESGNTIKLRECAASAAGFDYGVIVKREPKATANPEAKLVATDDRYGDWLAANEAELSVILDGPSDSTIEFSAPKAQIVNAQEGEREGIVIDDIEWMFNKNGATADQELSIVFTEAT